MNSPDEARFQLLGMTRRADIPGDSQPPHSSRRRVARILYVFVGEGRSIMTHLNAIGTTPVQKVVVVNGSADVLGMLDAVLEAGRYDMVFVESDSRAYSQIKKVRPNLVILCTRIDQLDGIQLLTMLKLDPDTRQVPVLTYTVEWAGRDLDEAISQLADDDGPAVRPALRMN